MVPPASGRYGPTALPDTVHLVPSNVYVAPLLAVQVSLIAGLPGKSSGTALSSVNHRDHRPASRRDHHGDAGPVLNDCKCNHSLQPCAGGRCPVFSDYD